MDEHYKFEEDSDDDELDWSTMYTWLDDFEETPSGKPKLQNEESAVLELCVTRSKQYFGYSAHCF